MDNCSVYIVKHRRDFKGTRLVVKVGLADKVKRRMGQLKTAAPYGLKVIGVFTYPSRQVAESKEDYIHTKYERYLTHQGTKQSNPFVIEPGKEWLEVPRRILYCIENDLEGRPYFTLWQHFRMFIEEAIFRRKPKKPRS